MARLKRLASAAVSVALAAVMLTSCSAGRYCMSYSDNKQVNSGIYIYNIISELINQQYMSYYTGSTKECLIIYIYNIRHICIYSITILKSTLTYIFDFRHIYTPQH